MYSYQTEGKNTHEQNEYLLDQTIHIYTLDSDWFLKIFFHDRRGEKPNLVICCFTSIHTTLLPPVTFPSKYLLENTDLVHNRVPQYYQYSSYLTLVDTSLNDSVRDVVYFCVISVRIIMLRHES